MKFPALFRTAVGVFLPAWVLLTPSVSTLAEGPDVCRTCHEPEYSEWKSSLHSKAYSSEIFQRSWKENGSKPSCLQCHTTGWKTGTDKYAHPGVTCESCHGPMSANHPADKMPIPLGADMCRGCHKQTYAQWKLSGHGAKNIRCFDCHNAHGHGLRAQGGDMLCGSCHKTKMDSFAHATHHQEGLRCATCHYPASREGPDAIMGTGAPGHMLSVGADVCARCHEETVHKSAKISDLRGQVADAKREMVAAGVDSVFDLKEKARTLEWRVHRLRQSAWLIYIIGMLVGFGLGWLFSWYLLRPRGGK